MGKKMLVDMRPIDVRYFASDKFVADQVQDFIFIGQRG
jgi:hypothetical protein